MKYQRRLPMKRNSNFYYFKRKPVKLKNRFERWRGVAELLRLTTKERLRVEWMIFYYREANKK